ncbi:MAG: hypothetical protein OEV78_10160 [Spirochaetia bacterium]|nr:hypothetical protein [Spirochaetia bacterium]
MSMLKFIQKTIVFLILCSPILRIDAVSWAILPVKFNGYAKNHLTNGPQFNTDDPESGWQMAQLIRLYLKSNFVNTVLPMESVKRAYKKNSIGYNADLSEHDLKSISYDLDCDKVVLTEIYFSKTTIRVESRVFFTHSGKISDTITISGEKLFETLGQSLQNRFQFIGNNFISRDERYHFIFGLDASGKNYNEIHSLTNLISELDIDRSSAVAVDGYAKTFLLQPTQEKTTLLDYIDHVKPQSTDTQDRLYINLLDSIMNIIDKNNSTEEKKVVILVVTSAPKQMKSRQKVNGFIRRITHRSKILILGNGKLSPEERNYWSLMTTGNANISYRDILYKQKIGLSDGNSVYLMKSGDKLLESNIGEVQFSHEIFIDKDDLKNFNQDTIVKIFETTTQKNVVSPGKPQIDYNISMLSDTIKITQSESKPGTARILMLIENKPFWIEVPYKSILDDEGKSILTKGQKYYFLLNLMTASRGMPFKNSPLFGEVLEQNEVSKILILNIDLYLKNPEMYINKSIAGTSLYIIYGEVKDIQVEKKRIY